MKRIFILLFTLAFFCTIPFTSRAEEAYLHAEKKQAIDFGTVKQLYDQMPNPKVVVAVGVCACTGGIFKECYNILGGADTTVPVDIYVPGCAARPQAIIDGIVKAVELFQQRSDEHDALKHNKVKEG